MSLSKTMTLTSCLIATFAIPSLTYATVPGTAEADSFVQKNSIQLGPRPYFLMNDMDDGELKDKLKTCEYNPPHKTDFSIGHRGAALQFPEHTKESYEAAARMGAGIIECDVTFTKDRELVCRHSQCDLHTTTNILETPLAEKCSVPFTPANPITGEPAKVTCCTSDITLDEFKTLKGKMDAGNADATTVEQYMDATAGFRTDLYATRGTLMSHAESIELFKSLGVKMTPELKTPSVEMPFEGHYWQNQYAQQMINEYKEAGVDPSHVWAQSFQLADIRYWLAKEPAFGAQAVYLDDRYGDPDFDHNNPYTYNVSMESLKSWGVNYLAPPMWMLVDTDANNQLVPSVYAREAQDANLNLITWTLERSGPLSNGGGWYYQTTQDVTNNDGDMLKLLDVLAQQVGIVGMFSDWPATVTYYANCFDL